MLGTGLVSLFTDLSTEMIIPILPLFLRSTLGATAEIIGLIEGGSEVVARVTGYFSGRFSDRLARRKPFMVLGYSLSNILKVFLFLTGSWGQALAIRWLERLGKGLRGAPRDALLADSTPPESWGMSFGFHRAMDTAGAVLGPLAAFLLLTVYRDGLRMVFLWTALPGLAAVLALLFLVRDVRRHRADRAAAPPPDEAGGGASGEMLAGRNAASFRLFLVVTGIFALGNSADAFLILRADNLGLPMVVVPLAYLVFNVVYALASLPAGVLADRIGRRRVFAAGYLFFALIYLGFGLAGAAWEVWPLFAVYGFYYAATEGVGKAMLAQMVPAGSRATAVGTYGLVTGLGALPASLVAGFLWDRVGPAAPFFYGAGMAGLALVTLVATRSAMAESTVL